MSEKEPPNPFDEIQKQLRELFKNSEVKISASGFQTDFNDEAAEGEASGVSSTESNSSDEVLDQIKNFH